LPVGAPNPSQVRSTLRAMRSGRSLLIAALPVGTVAAVDPWGLSPFGPLRFALVSVVMALIAGFVGRGGGGGVPRSVASAGGLLVVWALLSSIAAVSVSAWLGTTERHYGFFTVVLVALAFWAGSRMRGDDVRMLKRGCVAGALFVGGWVLWEKAFRQPIAYATSSNRAGGPFGSAALLGAACCLLLPLAFGKSAWRIVAAVGLAFGLFASGSRAAVVAVAMVGLAWVLRRSARGGGRVLATVGLAGAIAVVALVGAVGGQFSRSRGQASRVDEWRIGLRAVGRAPVLGAGAEGYRVVFPRVVDDSYVRTYGRTEITDRAHSGPLDVAIMFGIPGGLLYFGLLFMVAWRAWRSRSAVGFAVLAYFVQQLVLFPLSELDFLAWTLAGTLFSVPQPVSNESISIRWNARTALAVVGATVLVAAGVLDVAADRTAKSALSARAALSPTRAASLGRQLVRLRPDSIRARLIAARALETSDDESVLREALAVLDRAESLTPDDSAVAEERALVIARIADRTNVAVDRRAARDAYERLVVTDPRNPRAWRGLAVIRRIDTDSLRADEALARAAELENRPAATP
jgi:O-antigen ligase